MQLHANPRNFRHEFFLTKQSFDPIPGDSEGATHARDESKAGLGSFQVPMTERRAGDSTPYLKRPPTERRTCLRNRM
jgi:hypothetical protein